ncbi:MAG: MFS transporter [Syntrophobacteraceae bacterium]|nr:MFS transporter [Syntrophobacteraceae bacterium]
MKAGMQTVTGAATASEGTVFRILGAVSVSHFLNDMLQSLILAIYPLLKSSFHLSFAQIGLITLTYQITASMLQPLVGLYTDHHPVPYSLSMGMGSTLAGLFVLALAPSYTLLLVGASLVGAGSAVFHPESSRVARMASGGRYGLAQSIFQVGGNSGAAMGPLLAAWIILPRGREDLVWFSVAAAIAMVVLWHVGRWCKRGQAIIKKRVSLPVANRESTQPVAFPMVILLTLMFSKFVYLSSLNSYFTFYLMEKFHISIKAAQMHLFLFLLAVATGTLLGGPIGDRIGRKRVIWVSILGAAPFTLLLPHVGLAWTSVLTVVIGLVLSSAFSAILVYGQELVPGKVGMVSGLFFGLAFGIAGTGAAVLGKVADMYGIEYVYWLCSFLPLLGLFAAFLPDFGPSAVRARKVVARVE